MALIMYLTKAPRYKSVITDEYETIPREDIVLIEKYFNWKRAREEGKYSCDTLEEWCGIPESKLPHKYIVNYYRDFYVEKEMYLEHIGDCEGYSLFDQMLRLVKANHIFNWFINNVMGGKMDKKYYEVTKDQLESLLDTCNKVRESFTDGRIVNEDIAKELLPLMDKKGLFFGADNYGEAYADQVIKVTEMVDIILKTTNFEEEVVYFNAIW